MDWIIAASLLIFACAIFSGIPIPFGFLISIIFLSITKGIDPSFLLPVGFTSINSVTLLSMPFFITLGYLVTGGSIARRLLDLANAIAGRIPGGLGIVACVTSAVFGAISGAAASSVIAIVAQRLVRVLCTQCKQPDTSETAQALKAQLGFPPDTIIYRPVGCRACRNTGYHGRRAIFEWMDTNQEIRRMVLNNRSSDEIREAARRGGMRTLAEDGWRLVRLGVTPPEEVLRVTKEQSPAGEVEADAPAAPAPAEAAA